MKSALRLLAAAVLCAGAMSACGAKTPPAVAAAPPKYPDFITPMLAPADPRLADVVKAHQAGWQYLQAGDLAKAEKSFQAILKKSADFYPSDAALGYLELARSNYPQALEHFDHVLAERAAYVPALVGRAQALLALSRDADALTTFEAALKADPTLTDIGRRVEVLRARQAQDNVAAARKAAQSGQLDEAVLAYQHAIANSPESAFLYRDLADVEMKQGKTDEALEHYRHAMQLDASDVSAPLHVAAILESRGDVEGALAMYNQANKIEPTADTSKKIAALEERAAYLRLPAEYRALPDQATITRGDLAALLGIRLESLLAAAPPQAVLTTDTRNHWASKWIMAVLRAGVLDAYDNHTFQPRNVVHRDELAQVVSRVLKLIAARDPALLKQWQSRQVRMSDVGVSNLNYADVSLAVSSGVLPMADGGAFQLTRPVSGAEAIDAVSKLEALARDAR